MKLQGNSELDRVEGTLETIKFENEDASWMVAQLRLKGLFGPGEKLTIVGNLLGARPGEWLKLVGRFKLHESFGRQFEVEGIEVELPLTTDGIEKYLSNVKGIGPVLAKRIVRKFGDATLDVINEDVRRLKEVQGIGKSRVEGLEKIWKETQSEREVNLFLLSHGVTPAYARRIIAKYGDEAIFRVQKDPYGLARDIRGIGFLLADRIAEKLGIVGDDPRRVRAGVVYLLREARKEGHVFLPLDELKQRAAEMLQASQSHVGHAVERLTTTGRLVCEPFRVGADEALVAVYPKTLWACESQCADELLRVGNQASNTLLAEDRTREAINSTESELGVTLAPTQRKAVRAVLDSGVVVITGGPGTGKTTLVRAICQLAQLARWKLMLAAPTGRAARRLTETTGQSALTLHRALEFSWQEGGFVRNADKPLDADLIVVDESSMVDIELMTSLLVAVRSGARLVLVGDSDQLPSVGPGDVLADVIRSGAIPVIRLDTVFRQAESSAIVRNAHRIIRGIEPERPGRGSGQDFFVVSAKDADDTLEKTLKIATERVKKAFGFNPMEDVQVIAPMHRGTVGCQTLNDALQSSLNPTGRTIAQRNRQFRVGDRVMQGRNDYKKEVFNGDVGRIARALGPTDNVHGVVVTFRDRDVEYDLDEMDALSLAYSITAHKSQGSEYPVVIIALATQHYVLLERNLLYTALTRARELAVVVCMEAALRRALGNASAERRFTRLDQLLRKRSRKA